MTPEAFEYQEKKDSVIQSIIDVTHKEGPQVAIWNENNNHVGYAVREDGNIVGIGMDQNSKKSLNDISLQDLYDVLDNMMDIDNPNVIPSYNLIQWANRETENYSPGNYISATGFLAPTHCVTVTKDVLWLDHHQDLHKIPVGTQLQVNISKTKQHIMVAMSLDYQNSWSLIIQTEYTNAIQLIAH